MMEFYEYDPKVEGLQYLTRDYEASGADDLPVISTVFGRPKFSKMHKAFTWEFTEKQFPQSDFPALIDFCSIPFLTQKAWKVFQPHLAKCKSIEVLPVTTSCGESVVMLNLLRDASILDEANCEFEHYPNGTLRGITKHCFNDAANDSLMVNLGRGQRSVLVSKKFRDIADENGLTGLNYKPI